MKPSCSLAKGRSNETVFCAFLFSMLVPAVGYVSFGIGPALLFLIGYLFGFIFWLLSSRKEWSSTIGKIYFLSFLLFIGHRIEEKVSGFFNVLSEMTGVEKPEVLSVPIILLLVVSVVAWVFGPYLFKRGYDFGEYLVWSFFASMGITELAHFVLPMFRPGSYGYFPGMISVCFLAPVAWYGMYKFSVSKPRRKAL